MAKDWKTLDTNEAIRRQRRQNEATTSGNAGGFAVPLGSEPLRPVRPYTNYVSKPKPKKTKKGS